MRTCLRTIDHKVAIKVSVSTAMSYGLVRARQERGNRPPRVGRMPGAVAIATPPHSRTTKSDN